MHAVARILLDGLIDHVQVSWVKLGIDASHDDPPFGADDFGGTLMEETISRMAGAGWGIEMTPTCSTRRSVRSVASPASGRRPTTDRDDHRRVTPIRQVG